MAAPVQNYPAGPAGPADSPSQLEPGDLGEAPPPTAAESAMYGEMDEARNALQTMVQTISLPGVRALVGAMIDAAPAPARDRDRLRGRLRPLLEPAGIGAAASGVRLPGPGGGSFVVLDVCGPGHEIGPLMAAIDAALPPEGRRAVREKMAQIVYQTRCKYQEVVERDAAAGADGSLVSELAAWGALPVDVSGRDAATAAALRDLGAVGGGVGPEAAVAASYLRRGLMVDPANTTLYLHPGWPARLGFFVRQA